MKKIIS